MSRRIKALSIAVAVLVLSTGQTMARPDMDAGKREFSRSCQNCHSLKRGEVIEGPSLAGVFGRRAGSLAEYNYSDTMRNSKIVWTQDSLDTYLVSPMTALGSGNDMVAHGIHDDDTRADLIEFLKHAL